MARGQLPGRPGGPGPSGFGSGPVGVLVQMYVTLVRRFNSVTHPQVTSFARANSSNRQFILQVQQINSTFNASAATIAATLGSGTIVGAFAEIFFNQFNKPGASGRSGRS